MWKRTRMVILPALMLLVFGGRAFGQLYVWKQVTPESAIRTVREFEGDPKLPVTVTEVRSPKDRPWESECRASVRDRLFTVRPSGIAMDARRPTMGPSIAPPPPPSIMIGEAAAERIARRFVQDHSLHPNTLSRITVRRPPSSGSLYPWSYMVGFGQCSAPGVSGPSACTIVVDASTGDIRWYSATDLPLVGSPRPTLSPRQAAASAVGVLRMNRPVLRDAATLSISQPDEFGLQRLMFTFLVEATPPYDARFWAEQHAREPSTPGHIGSSRELVGRQRRTLFEVAVDAHDGSVSVARGLVQFLKSNVRFRHGAEPASMLPSLHDSCAPWSQKTNRTFGKMH